MTCERVLPHIEAYFDGELVADERMQVEAHIAGCAACSAAVEALEGEMQLYGRYERELGGTDELWAGVLARIEPIAAKRTSSLTVRRWFAGLTEWFTLGRLVPIAAACAAIVLAIAVALVVMRRGTEGTAPVPTVAHTPPGIVQPPVVPPPPPDVREGLSVTPSAHVRVRTDTTAPKSLPLPTKIVEAEQAYLKAIATLRKDVDRSGAATDPKLQKPLDDIDRNIVTARKAVVHDPADTEAVLNMLAAYDQKVEVLQSLARYQVARNR